MDGIPKRGLRGLLLHVELWTRKIHHGVPSRRPSLSEVNNTVDGGPLLLAPTTE